MDNLEKDIREAIRIIRYGRIGLMTEYNKIYYNTTENIKEYSKYLSGDYKSALLPTASGDHVLEAILMGIEDITCFDINHLVKYFAQLKFGAIKVFRKKDYLNFMYDSRMRFNNNYFNAFKSVLDSDVRIFWEEIYKACSELQIINNLFCGIPFELDGKVVSTEKFYNYSANNLVTYLRDDNYLFVQEKLRSLKLDFIDGNLLELADNLGEKRFDLINLTNIYEYINVQCKREDSKQFGNALKDIIKYLNDDGKIMISYLYRCTFDDLNKYRKRDLKVYRFLIDLLSDEKFREIYEEHAYLYGWDDIDDMIHWLRCAQVFRYLKDVNINLYEVNTVGLGTHNRDKDMVIVYKKEKLKKKSINYLTNS